MDLNRIVTQYRLDQRNAARNLALLQQRLKQVPVSFERLENDMGADFAGLFITAELIHPSADVSRISENLPQDSADYLIKELDLPYALLRICGEGHDERFYREHHQISEWITPLAGATLFAGVRQAGLLFYRDTKPQYLEFLLERSLS